jgi:hypothetical protein
MMQKVRRGVESGFDLAMTELTDGGDHRFVVRAGGAADADVLADATHFLDLTVDRA